MEAEPRGGFLITRQRLGKILHIAFPLMISMVSGNLMTIVDAAMVGRLGKVPVAAVGISGFSVGLVFAFIAGLGLSVQVITSRRFGAGQTEDLMLPVNGGLILSLAIGVIIPLLTLPFSQQILEFSNKDPLVVSEGLPYFKILMLGIFPVGLNGALAGSWTGRGQTRKFTKVTVASHVLNIGLNYLLIFGKFGFPEMGIKGAAVSSIICTFVSASTLMFMMYLERNPGFLTAKPPLAMLKLMISLMLPSSTRQMLNNAGFLIFMIMMGMLGTAAVAGTFVMVRIMQITLMPLGSIGAAAGSLAGQAMGADQPDEASEWGYDAVKISACMLIFLGLPLMIFPEVVLGFFINDAEIVQMAKLPLQMLGVNRIFFVSLTFAALLSAVGDPKRTMYVSVLLQWIIYLPLTYLLLKLGHDFVTVWVVRALVAVLSPICMGLMWYKGKWKMIKI